MKSRNANCKGLGRGDEQAQVVTRLGAETERARLAEVIDEAECARRLSVRRETLSAWRHQQGLPHVPLGDGRRSQIRYIWADVLAWLRSRSRTSFGPSSHEDAPAPRRGRPRNVAAPAR